MSTASRLRHPKQPTPESGRPRLRGKRDKEVPINVTDFQKLLHEASSKQVLRNRRTTRAFGGVTREVGLMRNLVRKLAKQEGKK